MEPATIKSWSKIIGISIVLVYICACSIPYTLLEFILFQGKKLDANHQFEFPGSFEALKIPVEADISLHALMFTAVGEKKGTILYCHGNTDHLQRWGQYHPDLTLRGYDVLMYDFRGYGQSPGSSSIENFYADGQKIFNWVQHKYPEEKLTIYGRSLGTSVASYIASQNGVKELLLETPFDNVQHLFKAKFPLLLQPFPFKKEIGVEMNLALNNAFPIHIFQGNKDRITPPNCAEHLKPYLKHADTYHLIDGGKHKNLSSFPEFQRALDQVLGEKLSTQ